MRRAQLRPLTPPERDIRRVASVDSQAPRAQKVKAAKAAIPLQAQSHNHRDIADFRRAPREGRSCRGESRLTEAGQRLFYLFREPRLAALEQR